MCCENNAAVRPAVHNICMRPIDQGKPEEEPYAAMMHMSFRIPNGAILCRTFGLTGEHVLQLGDELKRLSEE